MNPRKINFVKFFLLVLCLFIGVALFFAKHNAQAAAATYSLSTTKTSAIVGDVIPVLINMNTGGNDIVVARVVLRYNKNLVSVSTSDIDLTSSVFTSFSGVNNSCVFPSDYSDVALRGKPCQIINNDATYGILSITLAMPSHNAPTQPGAQITGTGLNVATVNFHALGTISSSLNTVGVQYYPSGSHYNDTAIIVDDGNGTDVSAVPAQQSTMAHGDLNSDRTVDYFDYNLLHQYYGNTTCFNTADNVANITGNETDLSGNILCNVDYLDYGVLHTDYNQNF